MVHAKRITILGIVVDFSLFLLKLAAGLAAGSLAVLADAVNSLLDGLYGCGVLFSVQQSHRKADKGHPFSLGRADPMVIFVVALLIGIAAFELLRAGFFSLLFSTGAARLNWPIVAALIAAIIAKILFSHTALRAGKRTRSPALLATAAGSRDDILVTLLALIGLIFAVTGAPWMDAAAALVISLFLFCESWRVARENVAYLVGGVPSEELRQRIRALVSSVVGVRGLPVVRSHVVGNFLHAEVHLLVDPHVSGSARHAIAMTVQHEVERLPGVSKAFVHVDVE